MNDDGNNGAIPPFSPLVGEREVMKVRAALRPDPAEAEHPSSDVELVAYIDGTLPPAEREIFETHLEDCAVCRAEVADLRSMQANGRRMRVWPFAVAASIAICVMLLAYFAFRGNAPAAPTRVITTRPATHSYANDEWTRLVREALKSGKLPFASDRSLQGGDSDVLRGTTSSPADSLSPAGVVIDETRPDLRWPRRAGAIHVVSVYDGDREVVRSEALRADHWTLTRDLERGKTYAWQVEVRRDGATEMLPDPSSPQAMFRVVSERDHRELAEAKQRYPNDYVLQAVLYARSGLRSRAIDALRQASRSPPPDAQVLLTHELSNR